MRLALDLATKLGFAYGAEGQPPRYGQHALPRTGEDFGAFGTAYQDWLMEFMQGKDIGLVVYESPILPKTTQIITARKLYSLGTITEMVCRDMRVPCREAHMQSVRSWFIGTSRAPKQIKDKKEARVWIKNRIIEKCRERGWNPQNDDEADALSILAWALELEARPRRSPQFDFS